MPAAEEDPLTGIAAGRHRKKYSNKAVFTAPADVPNETRQALAASELDIVVHDARTLENGKATELRMNFRNGVVNSFSELRRPHDEWIDYPMEKSELVAKIEAMFR